MHLGLMNLSLSWPFQVYEGPQPRNEGRARLVSWTSNAALLGEKLFAMRLSFHSRSCRSTCRANALTSISGRGSTTFSFIGQFFGTTKRLAFSRKHVMRVRLTGLPLGSWLYYQGLRTVGSYTSGNNLRRVHSNRCEQQDCLLGMTNGTLQFA